MEARHKKGIEAVNRIPQDWIERAARVYASNQEASRALGIAGGTFGRLCRLYGIETPFARGRRCRQQAGSRVDPLLEPVL